MEAQADEKICGKLRLACGLYNYKLRDVFTWDLLKTLLMGQVLSLMICGTAVSCQYLADAGVEVPMLQSFLNYALLLLAYSPFLCTHKGEQTFSQVLKSKWWKYLLMGLADVEANYTVVMAYRYTTLTSIQLLDCFVVPVLMVMSWFLLKTRYRPLHYVAVTVCLLGVGAMVGADMMAGRDQGSTSDVLLGDSLVLISAVLYAVSNMCQEFTVKNHTRVEFLAMMGFFGTIISGIQLAALEVSALKKIKWNVHIAMLFLLYVVCMFTLYSFMPVVVKRTSATAVNLSLLTADLFSLFCGLFLFHYTFSALYIMAFIFIMVGFVTFNAVPTYSAQPEREPDSGNSLDQEARSASDHLLPADTVRQSHVTLVSAL
ncbi:solute carrier family 35 member F2 [Syngnathus typhle]|uniref:solute carrier family 35 member F2 n=1 Tax=Syngnathus typhle TaxID=161592 RepID=UPI002A6A123D|nr:solute carrier family 35 member F2 [Syngnathus typhle]